MAAPGPRQPQGAGLVPHCLVRGRRTPGRPTWATRPGSQRAGREAGAGAVPGRGSRGVSEAAVRAEPSSAATATSPGFPLLTPGRHSAPARASVPRATPTCAAPGSLNTFLGIAVLIRPTQPRPQSPARNQSRACAPHLQLRPWDRPPAKEATPTLLRSPPQERPRSRGPNTGEQPSPPVGGPATGPQDERDSPVPSGWGGRWRRST